MLRKFLLISLFFIPQIVFPQNIVINEVMSSNSSTIYDEDGDASDWIELYNSGSGQINLDGYHLSDDSSDIKKWQFGNVTIDPGSHLLIFASDKDTLNTYWHTNFKISASGEEIILSDSGGSIIDRIFVPASETDISFGRTSDGASAWMFQEPSPGSGNTGKEDQASYDSVSFSIPEGFYSSPVSVEMSAGTSDIYFTLDGSDPDTGSAKYSGAISINETKILKAISKKENQGYSPIFYGSYFINENTDLPVISLISDPKNLFDADSGIYTNYKMDWERPARVEFFEDDKSPGFSENCGIEIFGNQSSEWPMKSISVKFKNPYNSSSLEYPLFPGFGITKFKSFVLRNAGNDFQYTHIRDAVMQALVKDQDIDYQEYRPTVSFINGEYWGIYNIREKISEHYIANRHDVDPDNIDLLENNMKVITGDSQNYKELIDFLSNNDVTTDAAYAYLDSVIDLNECLLYFASQAYYDNLDWPGTNIKFWRERSNSGKWRWILFGTEFGFGLYAHDASEDHIKFMFSEDSTRYSNPNWSTLFQRKLVENPAIKQRFINQVADLLNTNFKSDRVKNIINTLADHISGEISKHRARWGLSGESLDKMTTFAEQRPGYMRDHVRSYFNCGTDGKITLNSTTGGSVKINTINLAEEDLPWSGLYFSGNPVTVTAIPEPGYKFDGWSGSAASVEKTISLSVGRSASLSASFSIDSSTAGDIVINEINYNSADNFDSGDWVELYNRSENSVDLSNWIFRDDNESHGFVIPANTVLGSGQYLVLVENDSLFALQFPDISNYIGETDFGLSGSGEYMQLTDASGQIIDSLTYDDEMPWPVEADGAGATIELIDAAADNALAENWKASAGNGTPGKVNSVVTSVIANGNELFPEEYYLSQNYPNPFNPSTRINYSIPKNSYVTIKIYNLLGQEISTLFKGTRKPGNYSVTFEGAGLASGVYLYQLVSDDYMETKKMILIK